MKRVLFVDYITKGEHIDYNNIQIEALCRIGVELDVCMYANNFDTLIDFKEIKNKIKIPENLFKKNKNILQYSFYIFKRLNYVKNIVKQNQYDYIIFSSYISIYQMFYKFVPKVFLINHYNLAILDKRRILMLRFLNKNYDFIVLNNAIKAYLKDKLSINSIVVNHGLFCKNNEYLKNLNYYKSFGNYIFMPASMSLDQNIMDDILNSKMLDRYLNNKSFKLVVKGNFYFSIDNIILINSYLSHEEYHNLFYNAKAIILPYNKFFVNRVSATLLESITYNIPCFLSSEYLYNVYQEYFNYEALFCNAEQLVNLIDKLLNSKSDIKIFYKNKENEISNWNFLLD